MELIKIGKKGQATIPRALLRCVGMTEAGPMLAEATNDGAIVLRPAAVYPIEIYSDERIAEFEQANAVSDAVLNKVRQRLDDRNA